ncbi:MAG: tetratricopeptide repeat protein [Proteobacteria bacterium]|nr:tetratricopeptide repeat protein [Pseudomonadota bacterium]
MIKLRTKYLMFIVAVIGLALMVSSSFGSLSAQMYLNLGDSYNQNGNYQEALEEIEKAIEIDPNNADAWAMKGSVLSDLGRHQEAFEALEKSLELDPDNLNALMHKSYSLFNLGRDQEAIFLVNEIIDRCDKIIEANPNDYQAWHIKGSLLYTLGKNEDALIAMNKALEFDPSNEHSFSVKGDILFDLRRYQESFEAYDNATKLNPNLAHFWENKGRVLAAMGRIQEAEEAYNKAINLSMDDATTQETSSSSNGTSILEISAEQTEALLPPSTSIGTPPLGMPTEKGESLLVPFVVAILIIGILVGIIISSKKKGKIEQIDEIEGNEDDVLSDSVKPPLEKISKKITGHEIFICYSSKDKPIADAMCTRLESSGIRCWYAPRDVLPGTNYQEEIIDSIDKTKIMVLIFSANSNDSPHVIRELTKAVSKGVIILPFRTEEILPSKSMEYLIGLPHWLDAMTPPLEQHLEKLTETVQLLLNRNTSGENK